ncbi:hypothetical protein SS50377_20842 [Spironucleus salmonicida]|uniref:DUF523 domain-containing protein n=1 Tax=Spironucleus salmonicida TaxID=348837 RepID=A0A9P8LZV6_9EUKA|nr:hypothetical protein SS50377_20842 [Spironucleus salmonicida]
MDAAAWFHDPRYAAPPNASELITPELAAHFPPGSLLLLPNRAAHRDYPGVPPAQFALRPERPKIGVSACLTGERCRYDGGHAAQDLERYAGHALVRFCPEQLGGLPTPREPADLCGEEVLTRSGTRVTLEFRRGAEAALQGLLAENVVLCVLKRKSPSCGVERGGVTARLLERHGFACVDSER